MLLSDLGHDRSKSLLLRMPGSVMLPTRTEIRGQLPFRRADREFPCLCEKVGSIEALSGEHCTFEMLYAELSTGEVAVATGLELFLDHQTEDTRCYSVAAVCARLPTALCPELMLASLRVIPDLSVHITTVFHGIPPGFETRICSGDRILRTHGPVQPTDQDPYHTVAVLLQSGASVDEVRKAIPHLHSFQPGLDGPYGSSRNPLSNFSARLWDCLIVAEVLRHQLNELIRAGDIGIPALTQEDDETPPTLGDLNEEFGSLAALDAQARGYALERFLTELIACSGMSVVRSFSRNDHGEQIDLAFYADGWFYLVECRWRTQRMNIRDIDGLAGQLSRSGRQTMGIFLAINGWSAKVPSLLKQNGCKNIILMDGDDLACVLSGEIGMAELLQTKVAALNLQNEPFLAARDICRGRRALIRRGDVNRW